MSHCYLNFYHFLGAESACMKNTCAGMYLYRIGAFMAPKSANVCQIIDVNEKPLVACVAQHELEPICPPNIVPVTATYYNPVGAAREKKGYTYTIYLFI